MTPGAVAVSVVLPFRDAAATLAAALDSLRSQTLSAFECVLVDHHSRDASRSIARAACELDRRFKLITEPGSFVDALNAGCAATQGPFIARMDADDIATPHRLEAQHAMLTAVPSLVVASGLVHAFPAPLIRDGMRRYVAWSNSLCDPDHIRESLFIESPLIHPSVTLRRSAFDRAGGYQACDGPEDYDLWLRMLLSNGRAAKVPAVLLHWRDGPTRLTRTDPHYATARIFETKLRYLPRLLPSGTAVQICGGGPIGRRWARAMRRLGHAVRRFVDVDPKKQGREIDGVAVDPPDHLDGADGFVLGAVGKPGVRPQIETYLRARGLRPWSDYLMVA